MSGVRFPPPLPKSPQAAIWLPVGFFRFARPSVCLSPQKAATLLPSPFTDSHRQPEHPALSGHFRTYARIILSQWFPWTHALSTRVRLNRQILTSQSSPSDLGSPQTRWVGAGKNVCDTLTSKVLLTQNATTCQTACVTPSLPTLPVTLGTWQSVSAPLSTLEHSGGRLLRFLLRCCPARRFSPDFSWGFAFPGRYLILHKQPADCLLALAVCRLCWYCRRAQLRDFRAAARLRCQPARSRLCSVAGCRCSK